MGDAPTPLRKLRPLYPEGLELVIERCLQRRPDARFANIADFAQQLAEFGPPHAAFAVQSIYELVEPSAPQAQTHLMDERAAAGEEPGGPTDEPTGTNTTLYLQADTKTRSGWRPTTAVGLAMLTFALGAGVGWAVALPTDPTRGAAASPGRDRADGQPSLPGDARGSPGAAAALPAGGPGEGKPLTARPAPIDLDEVAGSDLQPAPPGAKGSADNPDPRNAALPPGAASTPPAGPTAGLRPTTTPSGTKPAATVTAVAGSTAKPGPAPPPPPSAAPPAPAASNVVF